MPPAFSGTDTGTALQVSCELVDAAAEQAWNDAAFESGPVPAPVLRLWRYRAPAVVLGRSQQALARRARERHAHELRAHELRAQDRRALEPVALTGGEGHGGDGLALVERRAGGGAVLVGPWMLGLSLVVPADHGWVAGRAIGASYIELGRALAAAMHALGVVAATPATEDQARRAPPELAWACFAGVTAQEVLVEGRKLIGLAQRRHRHGVLFVAGVLVDAVPWALLADTMLPLVASADADPPRAAAGLAAETISMAEARGAAVPMEAVVEACRAALVAALAGVE